MTLALAIIGFWIGALGVLYLVRRTGFVRFFLGAMVAIVVLTGDLLILVGEGVGGHEIAWYHAMLWASPQLVLATFLFPGLFEEEGRSW